MRKLLASASVILLFQCINTNTCIANSSYDKLCLTAHANDKDPKQLISLFDEAIKSYSKSGNLSVQTFIETTKKQLNSSSMTPGARLHGEYAKDCFFALKDAENKYKDYLKEAFQGNEAVIEIKAKKELPKLNIVGAPPRPDNIAATYEVHYIHAKNMPHINVLSIKKSSELAPDLKPGDILKIKGALEQVYGYAFVTDANNIEKVAPYNPS